MSNQRTLISPRTIIGLFIALVVIPFSPLWISWRWTWWQAWVYGGLLVVTFIVSRALSATRHPDLLEERANSLQAENVKPWDKVLAPLMAFGIAFITVIAGIEQRISAADTFNLTVEMIALAVIIIGYIVASYALYENKFFSGVVRIQTERDHQVVSSGPYRVVRHPGYSGALLTYLATPFFLDSMWALLGVLAFTVITVIRTRLEDQTLQAELDGYADYAGRVRYRLLPGVW
jgi:protein-S-isoprenylcysteine O-methyltransferase Ste14